LPVSSSGHLVLAQTLFSIDDGGLLLDTLLHLGTLAAVLAVYCKDIWQMLKRPFSKPVYLLVLATVPAVVFSLLFGDFFENAFAGRFLGLGFLLTSGILFLSAKYEGRRDEVNLPGRRGDGNLAGGCHFARRVARRFNNCRRLDAGCKAAGCRALFFPDVDSSHPWLRRFSIQGYCAGQRFGRGWPSSVAGRRAGGSRIRLCRNSFYAQASSEGVASVICLVYACAGRFGSCRPAYLSHNFPAYVLILEGCCACYFQEDRKYSFRGIP
jgi:hypothetical protein